MRAEDVVALYTLLEQHGVQVWVDGGWGVDALLGQQTRPHKDFDALVRVDELVAFSEVLAARGFTLQELWSENRWVGYADEVKLIGRTSAAGSDVATAFVMRTSTGLELDVHVLMVDSHGYGHPAWEADVRYPPEALAGRGCILNTPVRCLSAAMQMLTHTGYVLQAKDRQDLRLLHERFGTAYVDEATQRWPDGEA